jgi:NRAMP (natural resistance-associated macrophage protein)-like metal ion transporter
MRTAIILVFADHGPDRTMSTPTTSIAAAGVLPRRVRWKLFLAVLGPGLVVMLADTDVGSIITAAQSGAQWGYQLLGLQLLLVPILYIVQELTVRLGIFTGKGHGELIRETFGQGWAWLSVVGLAVASLGAIITEFSGVAGVGMLFGVPRLWSLTLAAGFLLAVVWTGSYRRVERVAILLGLFELVFLWVAFRAPVHGAALLDGLTRVPLHEKGYMYLVAANIGAVIMPWMVFYQQSAVADKKLRPADYTYARWDTAIGALLTQIVMAAILVVTAAVLWSGHEQAPLDTVGQIAQALTPALGRTLGHTVFGLGILGAAMVAAIVVALAAAWGFGEVTGYKHSLELHPQEAPWFYVVFSVGVIGGALVVAVVPNLVALSVGVEVANALMLPLVLGFLVALAIKALPPAHRLRGTYLWVVLTVITLTSALGVYGGLSGMF